MCLANHPKCTGFIFFPKSTPNVCRELDASTLIKEETTQDNVYVYIDTNLTPGKCSRYYSVYTDNE